MRKKLAIGAMALALPLMMVGQKAPDNQGQNKGQQELAKSDQMFLKALIQEDLSEIELANMALQKSSNPDVKEYAKSKILGADPEMRDGAAKILRDNGVTPPTSPNSMQKKIHDELSKDSGKVFDSAYMVYEASKQKQDVKLVDAELKSTKNSTVKDYVTKEKTPVEEAASAAKDTSTKLAKSMEHYRQQAAQ